MQDQTIVILLHDEVVPSTGYRHRQPVRFMEDVELHARVIHVSYSVLIQEII
jgi:hypothetical protein